MNKTIKFHENRCGSVDSDYYALEEEEIIELFRKHPGIGGNVFKFIENRKMFTTREPTNPNIVIQFIPDELSKRYVVQITMPTYTELVIPQTLKDYLLIKEPIKNGKRNG